MALSAPIQLQLDLAQSAFGAAGMMKALINATQTDNVHPAAVFALETLGSFLTIDHRLIGRAVKTLDQGTNYRMETLKLQLGLSAQGVPSQIRKSTPAIKSFLLITALRHTLDAEMISEILFEIIGLTSIIDQHAVSPEQLRLAVESLESHSNKLRDEEAMVDSITFPIFNYLASKGIQGHDSLFIRIHPRIKAKCIIAAFKALQNPEITQLEFYGSHGGLYLAATLWWLCGDQVQVTCDDGHVVVPSLQDTPKISVVLIIFNKTVTSHLWSMKAWEKLEQPSDILTLEPDKGTVYDTHTEPPFVPRSQAYYRHLSMYDHTKESLKIMGSIALALTKAACSYGQITKQDSSETIAFEEICSDDVRTDIRNCISVLGWPTAEMDMILVENLAAWFHHSSYDLADAIEPKEASDFLRRLDREVADGVLVRACFMKSEFLQDMLIRTTCLGAIELAEYILLHITQHGYKEYNYCRFNTGSERKDPKLVTALLGGKRSNSILGLEYLQMAMASVHDYDSEKLTQPVIAISERGYVAHLSALFKVPRSPAEAFSIIIQPGRLKWQSAAQQMLCDAVEPPHFSTAPNLAVYNPVDSKQGLPTLFVGPEAFEYSVQTTTYSKALLLRCQLPHPTDKLPKVTWAIVNWSLAHRPQPSGKSKKELLNDGFSELSQSLEFRHPSYSGLHTGERFPHETTGIAGYYEDERANFMRYGSFDANCLTCIDQGLASVLDCILYARHRIGGGWLIMSRR